MPATTFAELFGAIFPAEADARDGEVYGPTGDEYTGSAEVIEPPSDSDKSNGLLRIVDQSGEPVANARVEYAVVRDEFAAASYVLNQGNATTTNSSGVATLTLLRSSAFEDGAGVYEFLINQRYTFRFQAPSTETFTITEAIG